MNWLNTSATKKTEAALREILLRSDDSHDVFTPFALCDEIVNKIPSLDGKILVVSNLEFIYTMRMYGVDVKDLYFVTPCEMKEAVARSILPESNVITYKTIITKQDVGEMKFDVVVGNPPYQDDSSVNTHTLWPKFIKAAFDELCEHGGYVALVTPRTWTTNQLYTKFFTNRQAIHVNVDECSKFFPGVGSTFSWYVIQNSPPTNNTFSIVTANGESILEKWPATGVGATSAIAIDLLSKVGNTIDSFIPFTSYVYHTDRFTKNDVGVSKEQTDTHNVPILHKRSAKGVDTLFYATDTDTKQQRVPRVVFSLWVGRWEDMFVTNSIHTCQQFIHISTPTLEEANNLKVVLQSKLYKFIMTNSVSGGSLTMKSTSNFPQVDLTRSWTDAELYEHFNLTEEEIKLIEDTIK